MDRQQIDVLKAYTKYAVKVIETAIKYNFVATEGKTILNRVVQQANECIEDAINGYIKDEIDIEDKRYTKRAIKIINRALRYGFFACSPKEDTFDGLISEAIDVIENRGEPDQRICVMPEFFSEDTLEIKYKNETFYSYIPNNANSEYYFCNRFVTKDARLIEFYNKTPLSLSHTK